MYHHVKKLMYTVRVDEPDPQFGNMLLEQFGGANGELAAAMQYSIQGLNCDDPERKDLLMDIGTEELSHLEIVGTLARLHLKPMKFDRDAAEADPLIAIAGGGGVNLFNSQGNPWTADYLKITGELDVDLRSNIAAEARAKIVYERLINFTDDAGTKDALQFLMTREITHMKAFTAALESMGKPPLLDRQDPADARPGRSVLQRLHRRGRRRRDRRARPLERGRRAGSSSKRRPSRRCATPAADAGGRVDDRTTSTAGDAGDDRGAAGRAAARPAARRRAAGEGAAEDGQGGARPRRCSLRSSITSRKRGRSVERLKEVFGLLGVAAKAKPCKGMAGLSRKATRSWKRARSIDDAAADLALIAAAQKVEHYEISAYGTARTMAGQIGLPAVAELLNKSLAEEEVADNLLTQIARELMSEARGQTKAPKRVRATIAADEN